MPASLMLIGSSDATALSESEDGLWFLHCI